MPTFEISRMVNPQTHPDELLMPLADEFQVNTSLDWSTKTTYRVEARDRYEAYVLAERQEKELSGLRVTNCTYPYMKDVWRGEDIVAKLFIQEAK